jgi:predicted NBD/HSP70 family sugar kinase
VYARFDELLNELTAATGLSKEVLGEVLSRVMIAAPKAVPRVDIAVGTMLSQATVSKATKALIETAHLLTAELPRADRPGRPVVPLALDQETWGIVGVHVHHCHGRPAGLTAVLTDLRSAVLAKDHVDLEAGSGAAALVEEVALLAGKLRSSEAGANREILGLGIEIGGHVHAGQVIESTNAGLARVDVSAPLAGKLGLPVVVENDVNAIAVWETYTHRYHERDAAVVVVFDEGVGGGLIVDGHVYRGGHGMAGEIGHLTVDYALTPQRRRAAPRPGQRLRFTDPCRCGQYGHVEAIATPVRILGELARSDLQEAASLPGRHKDGKPTRAAQVFQQAGRALGRGLAGLIDITNPARLLLLLPPALAGPAPSTAGADYLHAVKATVAAAFSTGAQDAKLTVDTLGRIGGLASEGEGMPQAEDMAVVGARAAAITVLDALVEHARSGRG